MESLKSDSSFSGVHGKRGNLESKEGALFRALFGGKGRAGRGGAVLLPSIAPRFTLSSDSRLSLTHPFPRLSAPSLHQFLRRISQNILFQVLIDFSLTAFAPRPPASIKSESPPPSCSFSLCFVSDGDKSALYRTN